MKDNNSKDDKNNQDKEVINLEKVAPVATQPNPAPVTSVADEATTILLSAPDQNGHRQIINDDADFGNK